MSTSLELEFNRLNTAGAPWHFTGAAILFDQAGLPLAVSAFPTPKLPPPMPLRQWRKPHR